MMDTDRCGAYVLLGRIGGGGMADVFAGRLPDATRLDQVVAIKRLRAPLADEARYRIMFEDETRIAASIQHTHVVPVLGHGLDSSERPYIVMPLVDGVTLGTLLDESEHAGVVVPPALIAEVIAQAAEGLHAAHTARAADGRPLRVVHRDVSPANIMVETTGRVRVADFGVAWAVERATQTLAGELKGNVRYLSPEQLRGEAIDRRSDVFALGIVAWEALAGRQLFGADNPAAALHQILHGEIPRLEGPLADCVARALEKDRRRRYTSADEFACALREASAHTNRAQIACWVRDVALERIEERKRMLTEAARTVRDATPSQPIPSIAPASPSFPWKVVIVCALLGFGATTTFMLGQEFLATTTWSVKSSPPRPFPAYSRIELPAPARPAASEVSMNTANLPSVVMSATATMQPSSPPPTPAPPSSEPDDLRMPDYGMLVDPWR